MTTGPQGTAARRAVHLSEEEDRGNFYGIFAMQASILMLVTNDTFIKLVGGEVTAGQMVFIRAAFATVFVFGLCFFKKQLKHIGQGKHPAILQRGLYETLSAFCVIMAIANMPLANVAAILLAIPLTTTAAAALFLNEQVGVRRWSAVIVGFLGVVAIVRPGLEGFTVYALWALCGVFFAATRDLITRTIPRGTSHWIVTLMTLIISTIGGAILLVGESSINGSVFWQTTSSTNLIFLAGAGLFLTLGHYFLSIAMNHGEVSVVSSFRYIAMPIALVYGYLIWGEVPDLLTWFGISLILASGIYTIYRERQVQKQQKKLVEAN